MPTRIALNPRLLIIIGAVITGGLVIWFLHSRNSGSSTDPSAGVPADTTAGSLLPVMSGASPPTDTNGGGTVPPPYQTPIYPPVVWTPPPEMPVTIAGGVHGNGVTTSGQPPHTASIAAITGGGTFGHPARGGLHHYGAAGGNDWSLRR